jgi:uncharacterized membrane protein
MACGIPWARPLGLLNEVSHRPRMTASCAVCGQVFPVQELLHSDIVREGVSLEIQKDHPGWGEPGQYICLQDLAHYRAAYVHTLLLSEKGELSSLDQEVLDSMRKHQTVAADVDSEVEENWTFAERLADRIADFGGSWAFLITFGTFILVWITINSLVMWWHPVDPYPFILLNLLLSCLAAIQAPIIMMSQNRQEAKDRMRARNDYQVNLKAELEIRHLHEKMDHLLTHQWERLVQIQEVQLDLLSELRRQR